MKHSSDHVSVALDNLTSGKTNSQRKPQQILKLMFTSKFPSVLKANYSYTRTNWTHFAAVPQFVW